MKNFFRLRNAAIFAASLSFAFTACDPEPEVSTHVITFEDVALGSNGSWNGSDKSGTFSSFVSWGSTVHSYAGGFKSGILTCANSFFQEQTYFTPWWEGMACSNHTVMDSIGYGNQYSVYAPSGAAGSEKFALVGSDSAYCSFLVPVEVKSLMFNNSTYVYWALKEGKDGAGYARKFKAGDYFYVTVTGYDASNVKTGEVVMYLADFRDNKSDLCSDWTKLSLELLGKVKSMVFRFTSSDTGDYGMNTPKYVCLDNIEYQQ